MTCQMSEEFREHRLSKDWYFRTHLRDVDSREVIQTSDNKL